MAYPTIASYATGVTDPTADHAVILPPTGTQSGDLIMIFIAKDSYGAAFTTPTGWTALANLWDGTTDYASAIFYKQLTEPLVSFNLYHEGNQVTENAWTIVRIPDGDIPQISTVAGAVTNTNLNPPSLTHTFDAGTEVLWIAYAGWDGGTSPTFTSYPTNMTDNRINSVVAGQVGMAIATLNSTTNPIDPDPFVISTSDGYLAYTVAVKTTAAPTEITLGTSVIGTISGTTLTISGTGSTYNYALDSPFYQDTEITAVVIEEGVTTIGSAFFRESAIQTVSSPTTMDYFETSAFYGCTSLNSVTISEGLTILGTYCFYGCTSLTTITLPQSLTTLNSSAFRNCSALSSITMPSTLTTMGGYIFQSCSSLTSIIIPSGITSMGDENFRYCTVLASVSIPEGLTSIPINSFQDTALTQLTIPSSCATIGANAFSGVHELDLITNEYLGNQTINTNAFFEAGQTAINKIAYADSSNTNFSAALPVGWTVNELTGYPIIASYETGALAVEEVFTTITPPLGTEAGDLILLLIAKNGITHSFETPIGWTALDKQAPADYAGAIFYKQLTGPLTSFVIQHGPDATPDRDQKSAWTILRIPDGDIPQSSYYGGVNDINPNPPSLTHTWDVGTEVMWIAFVGWDMEHTVASYPANFPDHRISSVTTASFACGMAMATLSSTTNPINPDPFTLSTADGWVAFSIAVRIADPTAVTEDGTETYPWLVGTVSDLEKVGTGTDGWNLDSHYKQTADIDFADVYDMAGGWTDWNSGAGWVGIGSYTTNLGFDGGYDGDGHVIKNLFQDRSTRADCGLFQALEGSTGYVRNLGLVDVDITGANRTGALTGWAGNLPLSDCYATGAISGNGDIGGFIGGTNGNVTRCYAQVNVAQRSTTGGNGGGFIGIIWSSAAVITDCYCAGSMTTSGGEINGFINATNGATMTDNFYDSTLSGQSDIIGATPKTTTEMQTLSTFSSVWSIVSYDNYVNEAWYIDTASYPELGWQYVLGIPTPILTATQVDQSIYLTWTYA